MLIRYQRNVFVALLVAALLGLGASCSKKADDTTATPDTSATTAYSPTGKEGSITGKITFGGTAPAPKKIDMSQDANCQSANAGAVAEDVVVKDGKLENVFIFIRDGTTGDGKKIADLSFSVPAQAIQLDQKGCQYRPHVVGIMTGQKLSVSNSDQTTHNVHPTPKSTGGNAEWNQTQAAGAVPIEKTFARAETMIPVKCNQHPWMKSYVGVLRHPFFSVSSAGTFEIKGVPAGTYTLVAWHEKGPQEKTISVTVAASTAATADFAFELPTAANKPASSLQLMPAIEFPMMKRN